MSQKITAGTLFILAILGFFAFLKSPARKFSPKIYTFDECLRAGNPVQEGNPRECRTQDGIIFRRGDETKTRSGKTDIIRILSPAPNQIIGSPILVEGVARGTWYFEGSFPVRIVDGSGKEVGGGIAQAQDAWMTNNFVPFVAEIAFRNPATENGMIILEKDNPSGLSKNADELAVPVLFEKSAVTGGTMNIKIYFSNNKLNPNSACAKIFPVLRTIPKTEAPARASAGLLLKGPAPGEQNRGFYTNIRPGVKINAVTIKNGTAKIDFAGDLGGSEQDACRTSSIRSQIVRTLEQFPSITGVVISVDGRTLQD